MAIESVSGNDDTASRAAQTRRTEKTETEDNRVREDDSTRKTEQSKLGELNDERTAIKAKSSDDDLGQNVDISV